MGKDNVSEKNWALTQVAFLRLLYWLDQDEQQAGEKYERLRQKLQLFFEHRGCQSPEDLTDKTLDRVARKLESGEEINIPDPASYCYGVAHNVLKEFWRSPSRDIISLDSQPSGSNPYLPATVNTTDSDDTQETEINLNYLDVCLNRLSPEDRTLILKYYEGDHRQRINNRHELSLQLGIPPGNLRIRALRIREQLYYCINRCNHHGNGK